MLKGPVSLLPNPRELRSNSPKKVTRLATSQDQLKLILKPLLNLLVLLGIPKKTLVKPVRVRSPALVPPQS